MRRRREWLALVSTVLVSRAALAGHAGVPAVVTVRSDYVHQLLALRERILFVDLREPSAFAAGHLPGAISLPLDELPRRYAELPQAGRVILYCDCPPDQAASAYALLRDKGYGNHAILEDGYRGWLQSLTR